MNAVLLIAHAPLANALRQGALHVFPDAAADIAALDVDPDAPPEQTLAAAEALIAQLGERPVLVLTDVFGATPCNVARQPADAAARRQLPRRVAGCDGPARAGRWRAGRDAGGQRRAAEPEPKSPA